VECFRLTEDLFRELLWMITRRVVMRAVKAVAFVLLAALI